MGNVIFTQTYSMPARKKQTQSISEVKFYDEIELASKFHVSRLDFHRLIKPIILADFPELCNQLRCQNPDIGLDSKGIIYLGNIEHSIILSTHLTINDYI